MSTKPSKDNEPSVTFHTTLELHGETATGIVVPPDVVARLGDSKRPPIRVTIGTDSYQSTIAVMGGQFLIGVSAQNRAKAGVAAGDELEAQLTVDTTPATWPSPTTSPRPSPQQDRRKASSTPSPRARRSGTFWPSRTPRLTRPASDASENRSAS